MAGSTDGPRWLAACALLWLQPGAAQTLPPVSAQDTALLAAACVTCHGPGGRGDHDGGPVLDHGLDHGEVGGWQNNGVARGAGGLGGALQGIEAVLQ